MEVDNDLDVYFDMSYDTDAFFDESMESEEGLLHETPESVQKESLEWIAKLAGNQPPKDMSKIQIERVMDLMSVVYQNLQGAAKSVISDADILETFSSEKDRAVEAICDSLKDTIIEKKPVKAKISTSTVGVQTCPCAPSSSGDSRTKSTSSSTTSSSSSSSEESKVSTSIDDGANNRRVDYKSFVTASRNYLKIKRIGPYAKEAFDSQKITYPLGVVFDEIRKCWWVCDRDNKVFKVHADERSDSRMVTPVTHDLLKHPSALAIYKEGRSIAVLCSETPNSNYWIAIVEYGEKGSRPRVTSYVSYKQMDMNFIFPCRGLARSFSRNLLTIDLPPAPRSPRLRVMNAKDEMFYPIAAATRPSFIASSKKMVAVSDLGANRLFLFRVDDSNWEDLNVCDITILAMVNSNGIPRSPKSLVNTEHFSFIAGLQFDKNGFLLVGDARGHTLKLFDDKLNFIHRVSSDTVIPYMSSFYVNQKGQMLMIDIHGQNKIVMGQLGGSDKILPWIEGGMPRRAAEPSKFSNRRASPMRQKPLFKKKH